MNILERRVQFKIEGENENGNESGCKFKINIRLAVDHNLLFNREVINDCYGKMQRENLKKFLYSQVDEIVNSLSND